MRKFQFVLFVVMGSMGTTALAAEEGPSLFFQSYYIAQDDERNVNGNKDKGFGTDLGIAWPLSGRWTLETRLFGSALDLDQGSRRDTHRFGLVLDLRFDLAPSEGAFAYLIGGVGAAYTSIVNSDNDTNPMANLGIGFMSKPLNDYGLRLRSDIRAVYDDYGDGFTDYRAGLGLVVPMRKPQERIVEVEKVVYKEAPAPQPPADTDGDGVPDNRDQCPNTPEGALVDARGCQKVLERDIQETLYLEFDFDKAVVRPDSYSKLRNLADNARKYPAAKIVIEGHADSTGPKGYNENLSKRRAWAVRSVLISEFGVDAGRITSYAYGETRPIASNATAEGRAKNRRVEAIIKATVKEAQFR